MEADQIVKMKVLSRGYSTPIASHARSQERRKEEGTNLVLHIALKIKVRNGKYGKGKDKCYEELTYSH